MHRSDLQYDLPATAIAQRPLADRDGALLCVIHHDGSLQDKRVLDLPDILRSGDLLVRNNSRVLPVRVTPTDSTEIFFLHPHPDRPDDWYALTRPARHFMAGSHWQVGDTTLEVVSDNDLPLSLPRSTRLLRSLGQSIPHLIAEHGSVPLPPYMQRAAEPADTQRYQTVFSSEDGSVAAPTAGLHFSHRLIQSLHERGVQFCDVTLHVGLGTFLPIQTDNLLDHQMHSEHYQLSGDTAAMLNAARSDNRRIICIGTTALRTVETCFDRDQDRFVAGAGETNIFITPPYIFAVDGLLTNFHQPGSTLMALVAAFADPGGERGIQTIKSAYQHALNHDYRFLSYGDATLILP